MSERLTKISLPGSTDAGLADWGVRSASNMIAFYRAKARADLKAAQEVLAARDEDFRIYVCRGVYRERDRTILQEGKAPDEVGC